MSEPVHHDQLPADGSVTLAGRQVHVVFQPGPGPRVIMLGGCGVPSYTFDDVVELLGDYSHVRLDRPGLVGTPWPGVLPTLADEVQTLIALLEVLGGSGLVVAHSMAGPHAEALARQRPDLISGLVLVDSSVEWKLKRPPSKVAWLHGARVVRGAFAVKPLREVASLGNRIAVAAQSHRRLLDTGPLIIRDVYRSRDALPSVLAEQAAYGAQMFDLAQLRKSTRWPGTPTVVLTAAGDGGSEWVSDQRWLADLLGARQVVLEKSRHLVMIDNPQAIADAVRSLGAESGNEPTDQSADD